MAYKIISFYRYSNLNSPEGLREKLRSECQRLNILGRILIAKEGINGAVSGRTNKIELFKAKLWQYFPELTFREQIGEQKAHHKLAVKVRPEICAFNATVDLKNSGKHLTPEEVQQFYLNNEEFYIIDARNDYEFKVGNFKNSITLPIKNFRKFPGAVKALEPLKDKKLVLYCTGGIRCEKASAYLKEHGFTDVNQLQGGIIGYVNTLPENQEWQGGLFVFDDRLISEAGKTITQCEFCSNNSKQYINCHNLDCDKLFIACEQCSEKYNHSCSEKCKLSPRRRKNVSAPKEVMGIVKNYYPKVRVALIETKEKMSNGLTIAFEGNTTHFSQEITEMRDDDGEELEVCLEHQLITIPVKEKVRKNDLLLLD